MWCQAHPQHSKRSKHFQPATTHNKMTVSTKLPTKHFTNTSDATQPVSTLKKVMMITTYLEELGKINTQMRWKNMLKIEEKDPKL